MDSKMTKEEEDEEFSARLNDACNRVHVDIAKKIVTIKKPYTDDPMVKKIADLMQKVILNPDIEAHYSEEGQLMLRWIGERKK